MQFDATKPIIISLGGSIFSRPEGLDIEYLKKFSSLIHSYVATGHRFVIVTGGGAICRTYQQAAQQITNASHDDLDWIGIASTRINAQLVRTALSDIAHPEIIENPTQPPQVTKPVVIGAGYIPGRSSDHDAVLLAKYYGATTIINLGSAEFVYTDDPKKEINAQKFFDLTWEQYLKIIPNNWQPGMNAPFDPTAAKEAKGQAMSVLIMGGRNLENFDLLLRQGKVDGTLIHP
jgi:uridylate kinase